MKNQEVIIRPKSPMMQLRLWLYPHRRFLMWIRTLARWQMKLPLLESLQWRFCRWVSMLTTKPGERILWRMPGSSIQFRLDLLETIQMSLYYRNGFQPEIAKLIKKYLDRERIFIDAGANVGLQSLLAAESLRASPPGIPVARIFAFEPNPRIFSSLQENVHLNHFEDLISAWPTAVSDHAETANFYLSSIENSASSSLASLGLGHQQTGEMVPVQTVSLASFIHSQAADRAVGLIKLDIEGAELLALKGAAELLQRDHPVIILEIYPELMKTFGYTLNDIRSFLHDNGYSIHRILSDGSLSALDEGPWPIQVQYGDIICLPQGRAEIG